MFSIKTTGDRLTDLAVATCLMVFGLMTIVMTAALHSHDSRDIQDLFWGAGTFLAAIGLIMLIRPGLAKSHRLDDYYCGALLLIGALLLLCNLMPLLLVYYTLILLCAFVGIELVFDHSKLLKIDLGDRNATIVAGFVLIVIALILAYGAHTLLDYLTYIIGIAFILSAAVRFFVAIRGQPANATA